MRVLIVCTVEFEMNGIVSVIMNYFRLCRKEILFDFLVHRNAEECLSREIEQYGSNIYVVDRKKKFIEYVSVLKRIIKNSKYDAIHVHGNSATMAIELLIAKKLKIKTRIAHCHNSQCNHKLMHCLLRPIFNKSYTKAVACSEEAGDWIYKGKPYIVIENGINVSKFCFNQKIRDKMRKEFELEDKFIIGHVGLLNYQKNHDKLFEIFKQVKEKCSEAFLLCVAGDKCVPDNIIQKIREIGIDKDIKILLCRNDVEELLQMMDFFVFPSRWEGLGMAAIEAQASGLYCLASEKVPSRIDITPYCKHLSLNDTAEKWCNVILQNKDIDINRYDMNELVKKTVFDIGKCRTKIMKIYTE